MDLVWARCFISVKLFDFFFTSSEVILGASICTSVLVLNVGKLAAGSFVNTLTNCFCRMLAFSISVNLIVELIFVFSRRGPIPDFVFSLLLVWDQKTLGLYFERSTISFSNLIFVLGIRFFTWLRTRVYAFRSSSLRFLSARNPASVESLFLSNKILKHWVNRDIIFPLPNWWLNIFLWYKICRVFQKVWS